MLYAIGSSKDGPLKIGRAKCPTKRLGQLKTGSLAGLQVFAIWEMSGVNDIVLPDCTAETAVHRKLRHLRKLGTEWFDLGLKDLALTLGGLFEYCDPEHGQVKCDVEWSEYPGSEFDEDGELL